MYNCFDTGLFVIDHSQPSISYEDLLEIVLLHNTRDHGFMYRDIWNVH